MNEYDAIRDLAAKELKTKKSNIMYLRSWYTGVVYDDGSQDYITEFQRIDNKKTVRIIMYANDPEPRPYGWIVK